MIKHHAHPKRRVSVTDYESALSINESEKFGFMIDFKKKVKRRNEDDNENNENDPNEILANNDK